MADVANLPFRRDVFDGVVSLHTIHHLPIEEHSLAYQELFRVLAPSKSAVIVNGWQDSSIMRMFVKPIKWKNQTRKRIRNKIRNYQGKQSNSPKDTSKGTFVNKHNANWLKKEVGSQIHLEIYVWRSVSVRFLRAYILPNLGGKWLLRQLYDLEERFPHFMGEQGQYPLIVLKKE